MMTVSDDGERTCPLCAEEMDLTDQQLKPCRCGYQICVWCWHHIIDLAEKEETIGRCPACRTPYDKERIVAMASDCERVVAELNVEKKHKALKVKSKASVEAKKHLTSVRVIQRNLVYIIGLPSHLCDESILERKEYFGQYGKVLKVSVSRPAGAQQTSNNTFSVYITYSREEEAVRCIQSVHNYVLDGKTLRACFGTTKYCHAWLRNMTCNNPDCLYLHDIGSHEDSFTKDEIVSAYTRTRVPQIPLSNSQRRSGSILPPPLDDFSIPGTGPGKIQAKSNSNGASDQIRDSPPNSSAGKSAALPAAASWGLRALNCQPSVPCSPTPPLKLKAETNNNSSSTSMLVENGKLISAWSDEAVNTSKVSDSSSNCLKSSAWHDEIVETPKIPVKKGSGANKSARHDEVVMTSKAPRSRTSSDDEPSLSTSLMESSYLSSEWKDEKTVSTPKAIDNNEASEVLSSRIEPLNLGSWKDFKVAMPTQEVSENDFGLESSLWNDDMVIRTKQGKENHLGGMVRQLDPPRLVVDGKSRTSASALGNTGLPCSSEGSSCLLDHVSVSPYDNGHSPMQDNKITPTSNHLILGVDRGTGKACSEVSQTCSTANRVSLNLSLGLSSVTIDSSDEVAQLSAYQHQPLDTNICANQIPNSNISGSTSDLLSRAFHTTARKGEREFNSELPKLELFSSISGNADHVLPLGDGISRFTDSAGHSSVTSWVNNLGSRHPSPISVNTDWKLEFPLPLPDKEILLSNGNKEDELSSSSVSRKIFEFPEQKFTAEKFRTEGRVLDVADRSTSLELMGENNIISDILSLDFDPWDDSFSSNDLAKMLGKEQKEDRIPKLSNSWKPQCSNQSRFSFARQEIQNNIGQSLVSDKSHVGKLYSSHNTHDGGFQSSPMVTNFEDLRLTNNPLSQSASSIGTLKSKMSVPPGFSTPCKPTPPGFSTHDKFSQAYHSAAYTEGSLHGGHLVGAHSQSHFAGNSGDFELSDPAIMMAVGKDQMPLNLNPGLVLKPTFPTHLSASDSDPRLHLLMQQSLSSPQNLRLPEHIGDRHLSVNDSFIASQLLAQNHGTLSSFDHMPVQQPINSHFSNSQWDGWNNFRGDVHLGEMLRNDRYGLPNYYLGNDELKFHMSNGNIYNRAFRM